MARTKQTANKSANGKAPRKVGSIRPKEEGTEGEKHEFRIGSIARQPTSEEIEARESREAQLSYMMSLHKPGPNLKQDYEAFQQFCLAISGYKDSIFFAPELREYICSFVVPLKVCKHENRCVVQENGKCCECEKYDKSEWCRLCRDDHAFLLKKAQQSLAYNSAQ